jgi:uncharacterized protein with GYD domain
MPDIDFVVLLNLTEGGRGRLDQAVASLEGTDTVAGDLHGEISEWIMTHGQYDAVVVGHLPSVESIASFASWVVSRGFFTSETLIGADPVAFRAEGKGYNQS